MRDVLLILCEYIYILIWGDDVNRMRIINTAIYFNYRLALDFYNIILYKYTQVRALYTKSVYIYIPSCDIYMYIWETRAVGTCNKYMILYIRILSIIIIYYTTTTGTL